MEKHGNGNVKCTVQWQDYGNQLQKNLVIQIYENPIGVFGGSFAHIIEDAARVLRTKFESSDTSALVATEG